MTAIDLTCREVSEFLLAYLDHELKAEQRAAFEGHLRDCDECVRYLRSYERTVRLGKAAWRDADAPGAGPIPERLVEAILAVRRR